MRVESIHGFLMVIFGTDNARFLSQNITPLNNFFSETAATQPSPRAPATGDSAWGNTKEAVENLYFFHVFNFLSGKGLVRIRLRFN